MGTIAALAGPCIFLCSQAKAPMEFMILESTTPWIQPKAISLLLCQDPRQLSSVQGFLQAEGRRSLGRGQPGGVALVRAVLTARLSLPLACCLS